MPEFQMVVPISLRIPYLDIGCLAPQMRRMVGKGKWKLGKTEDGWTPVLLTFKHELADENAAQQWAVDRQACIVSGFPPEQITLGIPTVNEMRMPEFKIIIEFYAQIYWMDVEDMISELMAKVGANKFGYSDLGKAETRFTLTFSQSCVDEEEAKAWGTTKQQEVIAALPEETIRLGRVISEEI